MGLIRKSMSIGTLGLIDLRSDKERIARSSRLAHHELRAQTRMMSAGQGAPAQLRSTGSQDQGPPALRSALRETLATVEPFPMWAWWTCAVVAVLLGCTLVGLPLTVIMGFVLYFRSPWWCARRDARNAPPPPPIDCEAEARLADELGMPGSARVWRAAAEPLAGHDRSE